MPASSRSYVAASRGRPCSAKSSWKSSSTMCSSCETVPLKSRISARAGRRSVVTLDVLAELLEVGAVELLHGPLVLLHAPAPEVEVERRDAVLDRRPERPPVLGHETVQAGPRDLVYERAAVVVGDELVELREREIRLAPDVAELEHRVVVAGVLVVDEPEALARPDEVLGQQVVVAGHRAFVADGQRALDHPHLRAELEVAVRQSQTAALHDLDVALLGAEHVEVVAEAPACVQLAHDLGHLAQPPALAQ